MVVLLITFVALLVIGMPVAFVIGLAGVAFFASAPEIPFSIAVQRIVAQTQSYTFLAVPFFILAGNLMNESGITKRILDFASMLTRRMYGGLGAGFRCDEHHDGWHFRFRHSGCGDGNAHAWALRCSKGDTARAISRRSTV